MNIIELPLKGCYLIKPKVFEDMRGFFVKSLVASQLKSYGLNTGFVEQYHSISKVGVIRGMHFQVPPFDHAKLVYCAAGSVIDVILDLRRKSPTFGNYYSINLNSISSEALYIPPGMAHGFMAVEDDSIMIYNLTSEYMPCSDKGIRWNSFGFDWSINNPIISDRDKSFPLFEDFCSPF